MPDKPSYQEVKIICRFEMAFSWLDAFKLRLAGGKYMAHVWGEILKKMHDDAEANCGDTIIRVPFGDSK